MACVIDLLGRAGIAQGIGLDQALDMRVLATVASQTQCTGDAGIAGAKFLLMRAQHAQFQLIVFQQRFHAGSSKAGRATQVARRKLHYSIMIEK